MIASSNEPGHRDRSMKDGTWRVEGVRVLAVTGDLQKAVLHLGWNPAIAARFSIIF